MMQEAAGRTRGVFRRKGVWWIRWACSHGHLHREKIGPKSIAKQEYAKRKTQAKTEGFCLDTVKRERVIPFREIVADYIKYLEAHNRWARTDSQRIQFWLDRWGDKPVQDIARQDVEQGKLSLIEARKGDKSPAIARPPLTATWEPCGAASTWPFGTGRPQVIPWWEPDS